MRRVTALAIAFFVSATGCGFLSAQVHAASVNDCIRKSCHEADAIGHSRCEAACRNTYGQ